MFCGLSYYFWYLYTIIIRRELFLFHSYRFLSTLLFLIFTWLLLFFIYSF